MVSPSDLCPSSRVSWKILAAHAAGMRIRRPRPSTLVCRSRFRGGGLLRTMAIPPKNSTGSGFGTMNPCMGIAPIAIPAAAVAVATPPAAWCCRAPSPSSALLSCACASMARIETSRGGGERLDFSCNRARCDALARWLARSSLSFRVGARGEVGLAWDGCLLGSPPRARELDLSGGVTWRWDHDARGHRPTGSRRGTRLTCTGARRINLRASGAHPTAQEALSFAPTSLTRGPAAWPPRMMVKFAAHSWLIKVYYGSGHSD